MSIPIKYQQLEDVVSKFQQASTVRFFHEIYDIKSSDELTSAAEGNRQPCQRPCCSTISTSSSDNLDLDSTPTQS
jgi:hypothetical protein